MFFPETRHFTYDYWNQQLRFWYQHHGEKVLKPSKDNLLVPARVTQEVFFPPRMLCANHIYVELYYNCDLQEIFDGEKERMEDAGLTVNNFLLRNKVILEELRRTYRRRLDQRSRNTMNRQYRSTVTTWGRGPEM
jgi:hypothetical protein